MKNKKGFTLIELLAVIVILAIIALIATPIVLNVIKNAKRSAAKSSTLGFVDSVEYYATYAQASEDLPINGYDNSIVPYGITCDSSDGNCSEFVASVDKKTKGKIPDEYVFTVDDHGKVVSCSKFTYDGIVVEYTGADAKIVDGNISSCSSDSTGDSSSEVVSNSTLTKEEEKTIKNEKKVDYSDKVSEGYVVKIGNNYYKTLTEAINTVSDSTKTMIVFLTDVSENPVITSNQNLIFNLNTHTLSGVNTINGTLTIAGEGTMNSSSGPVLNQNGGSKINIENGTFSTTGAPFAFINGGDIDILINDATINMAYSSMFQYNGSGTSNIIINGGNFGNTSSQPIFNNMTKVTVNGGNFSSSNAAIYYCNGNNSEFIINDGTINDTRINSEQNAIIFSNSMVVNGGKINSKNNYVFSGSNFKMTNGTLKSESSSIGVVKVTNGKFDMSGGTIESSNSSASANNVGTVTVSSVDFTLTNGTISNAADLYALYSELNGSYTYSSNVTINGQVSSHFTVSN